MASSLEFYVPESILIVEPTWKLRSNHWVPDLVMLSHGKISDIFELKFVPHHLANYESDLDKLARYVEDQAASYPIQLEPSCGQWTDGEALLEAGCLVHFVVVARHDAAAVDEDSIEQYWRPKGLVGRLCHWYAKIGDGHETPDSWRVRSGI